MTQSRAVGRTVPDRTGRPLPSGIPVRIAAALAGWVVLLVLSRAFGVILTDLTGDDLNLRAIPLYGLWQWLPTWRLVVPLLAGVVGVAMLPMLATRGSWRTVLAATGLGVVMWSAALAAVDIPRRAWGSIGAAYGEHVGLVDGAGGPGAFLRDYLSDQPDLPVHLQAHPPGLVMALWALPGSGTGTMGVAVGGSLALLGAAAAAVAALVLLREVAGEVAARAAAPFVVLAPAAVWHTNADVVFGGVALTGVATAVLALRQDRRRAGMRWCLPAVTGGAVFGVAMLLSYGVALLALPVLAVAAWRRRWEPLMLTGAAAAVVVLLPLAWGFWWLDGLSVTRELYQAGVGGRRPYPYFLVANVAVFALAVGPAVVAGLARLRYRMVWLVVGSGLAAVALADLSGLSSGETERIWQPFMPLVLLAGCALAGRGVRWWLGAQVLVALVLQAALRSPW